MKTTSHLRMCIVVAMMTATACSEQEVLPTAKGPATSSNQNSNREYYTSVTTWSRADGSNFVGLVSAVPKLDLSKNSQFLLLEMAKGPRSIIILM